MFQRNNAPAPGRPGGAEYGVAEYAPPLAARPAPGQAVSQQLDDLYATPVSAPQMPVLGPNEVLLSRAYRAHDIEVRKVEFREPTGAEYRKFGPPIRYTERSDGTSIEYSAVPDIAVVANYAQALSKPPLPLSTVDMMSVQDINAISRVICAFFQ